MNLTHGSNRANLINNVGELLDLIPFMMQEFGGPSLHFHLRAMESVRGNTNELLSDRNIEYIYATLTSWGMHRMGKGTTQLTDYKTFRNSITDRSDQIQEIQSCNYRFCDLDSDAYSQVFNDPRLRNIFVNLNLTKSRMPLVANSKALAHIFPDLLPPMDRQYTKRFFDHENLSFFKPDEVTASKAPKYRGVNEFIKRLKNDPTTNEVRCFDEYGRFCVLIHNMYLDIRDRGPELQIEARSFNSSIPKIIDNLIVTFIKTVWMIYGETYLTHDSINEHEWNTADNIGKRVLVLTRMASQPYTPQFLSDALARYRPQLEQEDDQVDDE